ncbi:Maf family protein [Rubinisphaera margarita]|uniref:Maf family protein n=1 Tax=Rubinisphaera margarita TaxID=2909586 RepID=UPI001EE92FDF|nr:Maf family protein [Rubinisphaera margarita]MCG6155633.1 Maf family protein [Rubinisphaera margarita]
MHDFSHCQIVLGSSSPQRKLLLESLFPEANVRIVPPDNPDELEFTGSKNLFAIMRQLSQIARTKSENVTSQLLDPTATYVLTADTVIFVPDDFDTYLVLGKPPEEDRDGVVRAWFLDHYLGKTHHAMTAICLRVPGGTVHEAFVKTAVSMEVASEEMVDWYLSTGEPAGKAGGYAIQGLGSIFVSSIQGSLSNVVGLPLRETRELFERVVQNGDS